MELLRSDAGHGQLVAVHADSSANHARLAPEQALPKLIADHCYRKGARFIAIFRRQERASGCGLHAQYSEVVARDVFSEHPARVVDRAYAKRVEERGGQTGNGLETVTIIAVIAVGGIRI